MGKSTSVCAIESVFDVLCTTLCSDGVNVSAWKRNTALVNRGFDALFGKTMKRLACAVMHLQVLYKNK